MSTFGIRPLCAVLAAALWAAAPSAQAGRSCEQRELTAEAARSALALAHQVRERLDGSGTKVALIARIGQDLSQYGIRYTHLGFVMRDHPRGKWLVVHQLNNCGTAQSELYVEGLGNFFLDDLLVYESAIVIPSAALQERLVRELSSDKPLRLHGLPYNMVAYVYSTKYQNSNQWGLEMIAAASADGIEVSSREQAQAWLKLAGYQPITTVVPALTRLGGRMFRASIAFDDHPWDRRMADQIDTVTVDSVFRFVESRDRAARRIELKLGSMPTD